MERFCQIGMDSLQRRAAHGDGCSGAKVSHTRELRRRRRVAAQTRATSRCTSACAEARAWNRVTWAGTWLRSGG
jgi:hypothetical protein